MAEDAKLKLDIGVDGAWKLAKVKQQLKAIGREAKQLSSSTAVIASNYFKKQKDLMNSSTGVWRRHFDQVDQMAKMFGKMLMKFVGFSAKFAAIQVGALGAALMAVHGAFLVGQAASKAYAVAMKLVAGGLASITIAATIAAAAIREQQAAMYAYKGTNMSEFGKGINQINTQMRMMQSDAELATVGAEGLNAALAEIYKTGSYGGGQQRMLKALMDFGAAGQDIKTGAAAAGKLIAALNDPKATFSSIKEAAKALGPSMEQALTKLNITTKEGLQKAILDGSLAAAGGVEGQFAAVSGTLISQFKGAFTQLKSQAADFGQMFLSPTKDTFQEIVHIFRRGFVRVVPELTAFGNGSLFGGIVSAMEKLEDLFVKIMREYLPATKGMFDRLGEWWTKFRLGWNEMVEKLRPMIDGSRVLVDMFKALGEQLRGQMDIFTHTNDLIVSNREDLVEFGAKVGRLLNVLAEYGRTLREIFFDVLPFINKIVDGVTVLADAVLSLLGGFRSIFGGGGFGSLTLIAGLLSGGKSLSRGVGGFIKDRELKPMQTQQMNVSAGSVHVTGFTPQGQTNPNAGAGMGGRSPGGTPPTGAAGGGGGGPYGGSGGTGVIMPGTGLYGTGAGAIAGSKSTTAGAGGAAAGTPRARSDRNQLARELMANDPSLSRRDAPNLAGSMSATNPMHPAASRRSRLFNMGRGNLRYEGDAAQFLKVFNQAKDDPNFKPQTLRESQMKYQNLVYDDKGNLQFDPKTGLPMTTWQQGGKRKWGWNTNPAGLTQDINPGRFKTLQGELFRRPRESVRYKKLFGDYETGQKGKFTGGSMGMNMGASMAMGMLSNVAPKEMQGALALGSSLATINPMLGLGVGLIGGGLSSGNALAGAGMGAAGGAALGMQLGGPWGAAIGAVGGALIGGIGAWWSKNKRRKQEAKKAAERIVSETTDAFYDGLKTQLATQGVSAFTSANIGNVMKTASKPLVDFDEELSNLRNVYSTQGKQDAKEYLQILFDDKTSEMSKYISSQEELDRLLGDIGTSITTMSTQSDINTKVQEIGTQRYTNVIQALSKALGKSEEDVLRLAKSTNTNLFDINLGFDQMFKQIAGGLARTRQDIIQSGADAQANILDIVRRRQEQVAAPQAIDQEAVKLFEAGKAGALTEQMGLDFIANIMPLLTQYYGGDSLQAMLELSKQIGPGGVGFAQGSYFSQILSPEVAALFQSDALNPIMQQIQSEGLRVAGQGVVDQTQGALAKFGLGIGNRADFTKQIENLAMTDYAKYQDVVKFLDPTQNMNLENIGTGEALARELYTRFGLDLGDTFGQAVDAGGVQSRTAEDILAQLGLEPGSLAAVKTALEQFSENLTNALSVTDMSVTASSVSVSGVPGDTSTPRYGRMGDTPSSRFRSTYVNHSYFDSLISGKRTMTSGVRDFALGSINSDHVTGRALDLTGQNLGMYKTSIEAAGGFAEFHGSNASRHLHVVPPNGPVGDASTPVAASVNNNVGIMSGGGSGSSGQYVININGYNKTPQQLANEVLAVMRTNERSMKERRGG